jgi:cysteine desulfurase family protein (TIGR01976 family)
MPLDTTMIRSRFPALQRPSIFFDNPGGTQVAQPVLDRMNAYLVENNANHDGTFETSRKSDAILDEAHSALADFLNTSRPEEIIFGNNMTSLTFMISRAIARTWRPGDEVVVTHLDHDANITPWVMAAEDRGCTVRWVDFHPEDGTLELDSFQNALEGKPRLVALGYASNALGTINPVAKLTRMAHEAGAWVYIDAVQYAPHGPIDVQSLDCDFLTASGYKFFGPHAGVLYGKHEHLERLTAYKVRPAPNDPPGKFETGTQNHEGIAGMLGAVEYLEWVGKTFGDTYEEKYAGRYQGRRLYLKQAMAAIRAYEYELSRALLEVLEETPGLTLYGLRDVRRLEERVPTFSFTLQNQHPHQVAEKLGEAGIYVWDGNYYALAVTERLGLEESGGMVRVGAVHYNTLDEVSRLHDSLLTIVGL